MAIRLHCTGCDWTHLVTRDSLELLPFETTVEEHSELLRRDHRVSSFEHDDIVHAVDTAFLEEDELTN